MFFYYFLEVDALTLRYYVQPIEVKIPLKKLNSQRQFWIHVPDVLVFRNDYKPLLYQIKEEPGDLGERFRQCNDYCERYGAQKGWEYDVIHPKTFTK